SVGGAAQQQRLHVGFEPSGEAAVAEDRETRVARALATVRGHELDVVDFDETTGTLRLRMAAAAGCGCGGGEEAARQAAEDVLACFAPEVTVVEMETGGGKREPVLLQIGTRPGAGPRPAPARTS
ncbi:MAG: hypothetical protein LBV60_24635, partial [Streptomyces sp.]|nr:hypothetical protein [Streptomyces sp.]